MLISGFNTQNIEELAEEFEAIHSFKFPSEYKMFLLKYNGGNTPDTTFKIGKISSDIEGFFGLGNIPTSLNFSCFEAMDKLSNFLIDEMLPIGQTSFGDYVIIGVSGENIGKIFFLYHDRPKNYIILTDTFHDFVNMCKSKRLGHISTIEERKQKMIENGLGDKITDKSIKGWQAEIDKYGNMTQEKIVL